ncbi:hypothetical protein [Pseudophaeobacter sp. 1A09344]|uniref:hypothetical protein n=1 Tax=Pseudophaeobacter sp. 1A09344 TaxID=3098144 RepID=UPI0034D45312
MTPSTGVKGAFAVLTCFYLSTSTPVHAGDAEANALLVEAVQAIQAAEKGSAPEERLIALSDAIESLERIISDHPSSGLAVSLVTGQSIGNVDLKALQSEHDRIQAKVDELFAAEQAEATAKLAAVEAAETKSIWVEEKMACLQDDQCSTLLLLSTIGKGGDDFSFLSEIASMEVFQSGYSDEFYSIVRDMASQIDWQEDSRNEKRKIGTLSGLFDSGIFRETARDVFREKEAFRIDYLPKVPVTHWRVLTSAPEYAARLGQLDKMNEYLLILKSEGWIDSVDEERNELIGNLMYGLSYDKLSAGLNGDELEFGNWREEKSFYNVLAMRGDPVYEQWIVKAIKRPSFGDLLQAGLLRGWLHYQFGHGNAEDAFDELLAWRKNRGNSWASTSIWTIARQVVFVARMYPDQATKNAVRAFMQTALEEVEIASMDEDMARVMWRASRVLQ